MNKGSDIKERVLYVDDVKTNLMLFEASFGSDFDISLAESGKEALKLLEKNDFAVLVSDQNMPGMSGNELLEFVALEYPDIMRFMITAYTDYGTVVDSINKGQVFGYFNKPYNVDEVKMTIKNSLEVRDLRIKNREMIQKLEKANEELVEIDKTKIDFLSGITNEIRIPINKITTAVHMIKDKIESKELTESLQLLDQSVGRLESFSESAKQLVRLQDANHKLKNEPVSLKELVEVGTIEKHDILKASELDFKVDDQSEDRMAEGEFDLLLSCLLILMDMAISHSEKGSEILFSIAWIDEELVLGIRNSQSNYSNTEEKLLSALLSSKNDPIFEKGNKMEIVLVYHIISSHGGRIKISFEEDQSTLIQMILPGQKAN